jgi:hypothetical protein
MTKIQIRFRLQKPLDDILLQRVSEAHSLYGIFRVTVPPSLDGLLVEYDASRLGAAEVQSALEGAGIPVERA